MNMVSSNINQWSILSAMIPILFVISAGEMRPLVFDAIQRDEILLTILQSFLGFLLLLNLRAELHEALILFSSGSCSSSFPSWRGPMIYVYLGWCVVEIVDADRQRHAAGLDGLARRLRSARLAEGIATSPDGRLTTKPTAIRFSRRVHDDAGCRRRWR